jgi:hypothetical protein
VLILAVAIRFMDKYVDVSTQTIYEIAFRLEAAIKYDNEQ